MTILSYSTISKAYNTVTWQGNARGRLRSTEVKTTTPATVITSTPTVLTSTHKFTLFMRK